MGHGEVFEFLKGKVAEFKIPKIVQFVEALPRTASGKIQKFLLKELPKAGSLESEGSPCRATGEGNRTFETNSNNLNSNSI